MKYYDCDDDGNIIGEQETVEELQTALSDCKWSNEHLSAKVDELSAELMILRKVAKFASLVSEELQGVAWVENATLDGAEAIDAMIDAVGHMAAWRKENKANKLS